MINLSLNKQLDIIAPSTNRALGVVLQQATPQQLETIAKDKDLKSIMTSLLKESSQSLQSDKTLLELVKNNPTLKELGNVSNTIKDLLQTLKLDKNPLPIETTLKNFLVDIKELNEPVLKQKLENSGVFLESKLKDVKNPQVELKNLLQALDKSIEKSDIFPVKMVSEKIKELLSSPTLKEASNTALVQIPKEDASRLSQVAKGVENILTKLQEHTKNADVLTTKNFETQLTKLELLTTPKLLTPENFKLASLQDTLQNITAQLTQSTNPHAKDVLESLAKIMDTLKEIEKKSPLESLIEKKVPQDIKTSLEPLKALIEKADPVFSKETATLTHKLASFTNPEKLAPHENVKEILSGDLKSILLKASDEISKSSHPNQNELLKQIDKLSLQIDYYQLVSHLSNSTSLYLPFSWDSLEEGNINLKKDKEDKFYCDIDLKLKEYGALKLKLMLYEKNQINIQIYSDSSEFKEIIKENIGMLRSALIESQITPREIRLLDTPKKSVASPYENSYRPIDLGFEIKA